MVASGLVDELPEVAGLRGRWGRDVLHCPYGHGWEIRDQVVGVLGSGPTSVHQALLFRLLSADVTFSHTLPPTAEQAEQLAARGITGWSTRAGSASTSPPTRPVSPRRGSARRSRATDATASDACPVDRRSSEARR
jgi:hypothetical protein